VNGFTARLNDQKPLFLLVCRFWRSVYNDIDVVGVNTMRN
jgi:hypothetical protein